MLRRIHDARLFDGFHFRIVVLTIYSSPVARRPSMRQQRMRRSTCVSVRKYHSPMSPIARPRLVSELREHPQRGGRMPSHALS